MDLRTVLKNINKDGKELFEDGECKVIFPSRDTTAILIGIQDGELVAIELQYDDEDGNPINVRDDF